MNRVILIIILLISMGCVHAQSAINPSHATTTATASAVQMPYNRLIQSAGKVITWGDADLENHALDITLLPGKKSLVVEDRYGIAILSAKTNRIVKRWSFADSSAYKDLVSTYSGITAF